jgi:hypothetical protein
VGLLCAPHSIDHKFDAAHAHPLLPSPCPPQKLATSKSGAATAKAQTAPAPPARRSLRGTAAAAPAAAAAAEEAPLPEQTPPPAEGRAPSTQHTATPVPGAGPAAARVGSEAPVSSPPRVAALEMDRALGAAPPGAALKALAEQLEAAARQNTAATARASAAEDALVAERTAHAVTWGQLRSSDDNLLTLQAGALPALLRLATPPDARLALNTILVAYGAAFAAAFPRPA